MMENGFYILIHLLPESTINPAGQFYLGTESEFAYDLYTDLSGDAQGSEPGMIMLALVEYKQELPFNLLLKNCTLQQLGENCKAIIKALFKLKTLESGE